MKIYNNVIKLNYRKSISNGKCHIEELNQENNFLNSVNIAF